MLRYLPYREPARSEDNGLYMTYGIRVLDEEGHEVAHVADVSTNEKVVTELCDVCSRTQVSPMHLADVIEDVLYT